MGHYSSECLEKYGKQKGIQLAQIELEPKLPKAVEECVNPLEEGESFLLKQVLDANELVQRRSLFIMTCKEKGKCFKLIIDNGVLIIWFLRDGGEVAAR